MGLLLLTCSHDAIRVVVFTDSPRGVGGLVVCQGSKRPNSALTRFPVRSSRPDIGSLLNFAFY